ncbi:MAG: hypothetical protein OHK0041_05170 [Anaerolineales bacterium]
MEAQDHRLRGGGLFLFPASQREKENPISTKSVLRRYWKPALATSALLWLEELLAIWLDILSALAVILLAGPILLFNHFVFKSATPRKEDITQQEFNLNHETK